MDTLQFPIVPLDFDEVAQILDNIVDNDFPEEMYRGLTGGIYLVPEEKHNARIPSNRYYVLGEYRRNRIMGNCIFVYYGSFRKLYPRASGNRRLLFCMGPLATSCGITWKAGQGRGGWKSKMRFLSSERFGA